MANCKKRENSDRFGEASVPSQTSRRAISGSPLGAQSIQRCFQVLRYVAAGGEGGRRLNAVARDLDLHPATAHRMLRTLAAEGMLLHREADKTYRMGPQLISLAAMAHKQFAIRHLFQPALEMIARETRDTVFLQMYSGADDTICLAREEGEYPVRTLTLDVGACRPLPAGAAGLAMLMHLSDDECEKIIQSTGARLKKLGLTPDLVRAAIARSRSLGFAINEGLVTDVDIFSVGVLVVDDSGIVAAISVSALRHRMETDRQLEIAKIIRKAIRGIPQVRPYPYQLPAPNSGFPKMKSAARMSLKAAR